MQVRATPNGKFGTCGCGRSLSGDCDGSHALTEEQWQAKLQQLICEEQELKDEEDND